VSEKATLFGVPASHPTLAAELMLERKGIDFRRLDLVAAVHRVALRALGFDGITVPALRLEGIRLQGTRRISRALDALQPEPALFPPDPARRASVERAEVWGDEVLQEVPRRLTWWCLRRHPGAVRSFLEGARLGIPTGLAAATAFPVIVLSARLNRASSRTVRRDLASLPRMLERVDGWIADGTLGGAEPNAADYQIATSVRLLMTLEDLRPAIASRPAGEHAERVVPDFPGHLPAALPADWLASLRSA
jgi:glutathione S-transferase